MSILTCENLKIHIFNVLMGECGGVCIWLSMPSHVNSEFVVPAFFTAFSPLEQVGLGISTLLMYVPTPLAATHQSGSLALLSVALWLMSELRRVPK